MSIPCRSVIPVLAFLAMLALGPPVCAQNEPPPPEAATGKADEKPKELTLAFATMCESLDGVTPVNQAVVFSVSAGRVNCFTVFSPVPEPTQIYHRWYHRDELSTQIRLRLNPPRWATYSLIQLRETDKGPWRVEITDMNNKVLGVLRFSITD